MQDPQQADMALLAPFTQRLSEGEQRDEENNVPLYTDELYGTVRRRSGFDATNSARDFSPQERPGPLAARPGVTPDAIAGLPSVLPLLPAEHALLLRQTQVAKMMEVPTGPINQAPTFIGRVGNTPLQEAAPASTVVTTFFGVDVDVGDILTYSLADDAGGRFTIDPASGVLTVAAGAGLDFDTVPSHTIRVRVTDRAGLSREQAFAIGLSGVNEAPASLAIASGGSVVENSAAGVVVATMMGTDPDAGDVLTYSLVDSAGGRFVINASTGVVSVAAGAVLNREAASSHQVVVRATDASGLTRDLTQTLMVLDVNEAPTSLSLVQGVATLPEHSLEGTPVATFVGSDGDVGDVLTYSMADSAGGRFAINATTGVVTVANAALVDYEAATSFQITVRVTDSGGLTRDLNHTVVLTNGNEYPTNLAFTGGGTVAEHSAVGTAVATFTGTDTDPGDTLSYSLTDNAGGRFAINATTGVVTVANSQLVNYEGATSHAITVRVTDSGGLTRDLTHTITLTDVNDAPATLSLTSGGSVAENSANATVVATFVGTDVDAGDALTYSLVDNAGGRFEMNATTGVVTVANSALLDFEGATSHTITVRVTDVGGLTRDVTQAITLTDVQGENLLGTPGSDILRANLGDDTLNGLGDADVMIGGVGNDTYIVDHTGDVVTEASGEGTDTIQTSITLTLAANVEHLVQIGGDNIHGTGTASNDTLTGNTGNNSLVGLAGNDSLDGGLGDDVLTGGGGMTR